MRSRLSRRVALIGASAAVVAAGGLATAAFAQGGWNIKPRRPTPPPGYYMVWEPARISSPCSPNGPYRGTPEAANWRQLCVARPPKGYSPYDTGDCLWISETRGTYKFYPEYPRDAGQMPPPYARFVEGGPKAWPRKAGVKGSDVAMGVLYGLVNRGDNEFRSFAGSCDLISNTMRSYFGTVRGWDVPQSPGDSTRTRRGAESSDPSHNIPRRTGKGAREASHLRR
jgi:hypothetical protein